MLAKYGFNTGLRQAHFVGQAFEETGALTSAKEKGDAEYFRKMYENYTPSDAAYDFDNKYNWIKKLGYLKNRNRSEYIAKRPAEVHEKAVSRGNISPGDGARFKGRGLIHLTWRDGYGDYAKFRARDFTTDPNPEKLESDAETAADSAGYYWIKINIMKKADRGRGDIDVKECFKKVGGAGGLAERTLFFHYADFILGDSPDFPAELKLERQSEDI